MAAFPKGTFFMEPVYDKSSSSSVSSSSSTSSSTQSSTKPDSDGLTADIFIKSKCVVSYRPLLRHLEEEVVGIRHFDEFFPRIFGYSRADLETGNFTFAALCGSNTPKECIERLKQSIVRGQSDSIFIPLYRKNGTTVDIHMTLTPLTGGKEAKANRLKALQETLLEARQGSDIKETKFDFYGLITFRHASVVQSTLKLGVGILGVDHISEEKLKEIMNSHNTEDASEIATPGA